MKIPVHPCLQAFFLSCFQALSAKRTTAVTAVIPIQIIQIIPHHSGSCRTFAKGIVWSAAIHSGTRFTPGGSIYVFAHRQRADPPNGFRRIIIVEHSVTVPYQKKRRIVNLCLLNIRLHHRAPCAVVFNPDNRASRNIIHLILYQKNPRIYGFILPESGQITAILTAVIQPSSVHRIGKRQPFPV